MHIDQNMRWGSAGAGRRRELGSKDSHPHAA